MYMKKIIKVIKMRFQLTNYALQLRLIFTDYMYVCVCVKVLHRYGVEWSGVKGGVWWND